MKTAAAAHVEPTPATALPWVFNDECGRIEGAEGSIIFYVAGSSLMSRVEQDVYHTLHALHAYPRLIAALHAVTCATNMGETTDAKFTAAALLKELGE